MLQFEKYHIVQKSIHAFSTRICSEKSDAKLCAIHGDSHSLILSKKPLRWQIDTNNIQ